MPSVASELTMAPETQVLIHVLLLPLLVISWHHHSCHDDEQGRSRSSSRSSSVVVVFVVGSHDLGQICVFSQGSIFDRLSGLGYRAWESTLAQERTPASVVGCRPKGHLWFGI